MKAKQKISIALISFAVCSLIFLGGLVYPVFHGVMGDYGKVLDYKREILQLEEDAKNTREFEMLSGQYAKEFERQEELFVDSETPIAFFRFLDETAAEFNLKIQKAPSPVQQFAQDRWPSFEVRLAGGGGYPDVMAFLQKIENAPYLLEAQTLTISAKRGFSSEQSPVAAGQVDFSLSLKVFTK